MANENLNFEKARYNGVVTVIADQIKQISNLEKKYKLLQSEHNVLKRTYLNLLDGHVDIIDGKNKTIKRLRLKVKEQKKDFVNDLNINFFVHASTFLGTTKDRAKLLMMKWEKWAQK